MTSGSRNTLIGCRAGVNMTTQSSNTAIGADALGVGAGGSGNTAVGDCALTTAFGDYNIAIGVASGNQMTTGCANTFIGYRAGNNISTGNCNVAIGYCVSVPNGSCQLAIGFDVLGCCWLTGNSTKAIKPGAGIIDCANSCGTAGQVLTSTGSNALQWANAATNWTSAGTIGSVGLAGTTTAPTIGGAGIDVVYYRSAGAKIWQVSLVLDKGIGGTNGSGDYLFTLPNGLQFDTSLANQRVYTSSVGAADNGFLLQGLQGGTGAIIQGASLGTTLQPVIWSATQYRLVTLLTGQYRAWGSGWFSMLDPKYAAAQFQFQST